jgi:hypothetical protein
MKLILFSMILLFLFAGCNNISTNNETETNIESSNNIKVLNRESFTEEGALNLIYGNYDYNNKCGVWTLSELDYLTLPIGKEIKTLNVNIVQTETFEKKGKEHKLIVTESNYQNNDCHACTPYIGAALFMKENNQWKLIQERHFITRFGSFGKILKGDLIQIGINKFGILFRSIYSQMGQTEEIIFIIGETQNWLDKVFELNDTGGDNEGSCEQAINNCYKYKSEVNFVKNATSPYFKLEVNTFGTKLINNKLQIFNEIKKFEFIGDSFQFYK